MSCLAAAVLLGIPASPAALAQSLLSDAPAAPPAVSLRGLGDSTILSTRPVALARAGAARDINLAAFEQSRSALALEGEDDVVELTFVLDAGHVAEGGDLVIAYRNAVSVMPEASMVSVMINGAPVGDFPIRSPSGFARQVIDVSPALLRAGVNEVRLRAVQRHRVDCSMEATYELWTEIDGQASGFRSRSALRPEDFQSLRTLGRTEHGLTDLRLVLPAGAGAATLTRAAPVVQTLALALNRDDLSVTVAESEGRGPGIDLIVATDDDPGSLAAAGSAPYGLSVAAGADAGRARVVLRAATAGEIPGLLLSAVQGPLQPVLDTGIRARRKGEIRAAENSAYTLADAGYVAAPFSGRLFHTGFDMILPADFYPAEYATLDLALHAATSPGLKPTSQLLVRVNGHIVKSLPMRDADGEVFSGRKLELPLRAFRPGRNQIELLAELERAADDACVFAERDDSVPRFILLDTTEIRVPALARVARSPELAALAGSAYPYASPSGVSVHALKPDAGSVSAAMTMIAKMGLAARAPVMARMEFGPPSADAGANAIVIASRRAVEALSGLEPAASPPAAQAIDFARARDFADPMPTASIHLPGAAVAMSMATDPAALLDAFQQTTRGLATGGSLVRDFGAGLSDASRAFRHWLNYERPSDAAPLVEPLRKALLLQRPSVTGEGVVTWLTADTSLDMVEASDMLADPSVWNRLEGESVVLDLDARTLRATRPQAYFTHDIKDYGPGNLRRIAAAWFSDHFRIYVVLVLALMAVFAIWLGRAVPGAGVRTDR
ncbi:hypothetical protein LL06_19920 [Hoeflea sp. BAL378]|nr:hypothetical protein LL06_19920 [Hoeflea sp. BAL378]